MSNWYTNIEIKLKNKKNSTSEILDYMNKVYEIESEMQSPGIQPHIKASLKKKFIGLIRERANLNNYNFIYFKLLSILS